MTKGQIITLIRLLSAIESWAFSVKSPLPDYLFEMQNQVMNELVDEVLKDEYKYEPSNMAIEALKKKPSREAGNE